MGKGEKKEASGKKRGQRWTVAVDCATSTKPFHLRMHKKDDAPHGQVFHTDQLHNTRE